MSGPLKNSAVNTTGLKLGKANGKKSRPPNLLSSPLPQTEDQVLNKYFDDLRKELLRLQNLVNAHEQKLNHMRVDPTTFAVTFIT